MTYTPRTCPGPGDLWQPSWQEEKRQAEYERLLEIQASYKELTISPEEKRARRERSEKIKREVRERLRKQGLIK